MRVRWVLMSLVSVFVLAGIALLIRPSGSRAEEEAPPLADYYGFQELEIYKLELRSGSLLAGDVNHDGLTDLVLVDNSHSRIDVLQQRLKKPVATKTAADTTSVNQIANDWRFEHRKISVDREIAATALGDFNADGRKDIAYFGVPDRLVIRLQPAAGDWKEQTMVRLPDVQPLPWIVAAGDLDHDGKDDLAVLGTRKTYILYQQQNGTLGSPVGLMNTSDKLGLVQIADLDGDGRNDLCYLTNDDSNRSLCGRLQNAAGRLGPELRFELDRPRSVTLANTDQAPGHEIVTIDAQTGRIKVHQLRRPPSKPGELANRLIQYGFGSQGSGRNRDLATGDIDGDGLVDVVVSDPEAAEVIVFRQRPEGGLDLGQSFPGLVGTEQIRIADVDGDGTNEVAVLSLKEKTLGISRMQDDRLTFPQALPVENEPVAFDAADLNGDQQSELLLISKVRVGRDSEYRLSSLLIGKDDPETRALGKLELRGTPKRLVHCDANADGQLDFFVFLELDRAPHLLTLTKEGQVAELKTEGGIQLGELPAGSLFFGQLDGPAILAAQDRFARNLRLDAQQRWQVIDQYNVVESGAKIAGAVTINLDGQPGNEIALIDSGVKKLRVFRQNGKHFEPWQEVDIGDFPYQSSHVADLNGDSDDDLLLFGTGKFAVLYSGRTDPRLEEIASFETKLDATFFTDVHCGDLNFDKHADLALIDTRSSFVEIVDFNTGTAAQSAGTASPRADAKPVDAATLRHALHFKVFEEKSFSKEEGTGSEPREGVIADVTNDGRADLILLAHDRVLVYPQDDGH